MPTQVKIDELRAPRLYVRSHVNKDYIKDLLLVLQEHDGKWPFPPIEVVPLDKEKHKKLWQTGARYYINDGIHRTQAAKLGKLTYVPANVLTFTPDSVDAYIKQFTANITHGMQIDLKARAKFIKTLKEDFKMNLDAISKKVGLSTAQISRITRGLSGVRKPTRKGKGRVKVSITATPATATPAPMPASNAKQGFTASGWTEDFKALLTEFTKHKDAIKAFLSAGISPLSDTHKTILKMVAAEIGG